MRGVRCTLGASACVALAALVLAGCAEQDHGSDRVQVDRAVRAIEGIPQDGFTLGRRNARWTLTVIASATSFELDQMITMLPALVEHHVRPGLMKIALRTPSTGRYGANGDERTAAGALLAAGAQGHFWDALVRFVPVYRGRLSEDGVRSWLRRSGVPDVSRAMTERAGDGVRAALAAADEAAANAAASFPAVAERRRVIYLLTLRGEGPRNVTLDGDLGRLVEVLGAVVR